MAYAAWRADLAPAPGRGRSRSPAANLPLGHLIYRGFAGVMPDGDKRVFADPDIGAMFIDDILLVARAASKPSSTTRASSAGTGQRLAT